VARTIPICKLLTISLLATVASPVWASKAASPYSQYVQARIADADGAMDRALQGYAAALTAAPDSGSIAIRAFRQAVEAGDEALALRAARQLDVAKAAPPDAHILLLIERLDKGDWRGASLQADKIEEHGAFDFLVPVARAWIAFGAREKNPLAPLQARNIGALATSYVRDHEALMKLALKQKDAGVSAVRSIAPVTQSPAAFRLQAAAQLSAIGAKEDALAILPKQESWAKRARDMINAGKPLPGAVNRPVAGMAALLSRLASDLLRETASPAALTFARLSQFADPANDSNTISLVQIFARSGQNAAAIKLLETIPPTSLYRDSLPGLRLTLEERAGNLPAALALAKQRAVQADADIGDHARLGDVLLRIGDKAAAASAFRAAIDLSGGVANPDPASWGLWLSYGNALDGAGQWAEAKAALQTSLKLAPNEPQILNHLGYAMLERRDDVAEATRLISKANALKPNDTAITDSLGWAYLLSGNTDRAVDVLESAVLASPNEAVIGEHLGDAYWRAGRRIDARYAWNAARAQLTEDDRVLSERLASKIESGPPLAR
jgi:tetratricopeptide (TPR) repeat protein